MKSKQPLEALEAYFDRIDEADVSEMVLSAGISRSPKRWAGSALGFASACALGVGIAVALASSAGTPPTAGASGAALQVREQMARNGLSATELLGPDGRHSQAKEAFPWRA
jgi:hypothetical protein